MKRASASCDARTICDCRSERRTTALRDSRSKRRSRPLAVPLPRCGSSNLQTSRRVHVKQLLAIAVAVLAVVFLVAPGTVSAIIVEQPTNDGAHDFAVGGFERANGSHIGFSTQSGPLGENPFGHLSSTLDPGVRQ